MNAQVSGISTTWAFCYVGWVWRCGARRGQAGGCRVLGPPVGCGFEADLGARNHTRCKGCPAGGTGCARNPGAFDVLSGFGQRVQLSVFACMDRINNEIIDREAAQVRLYPLTKDGAEVHANGAGSRWDSTGFRGEVSVDVRIRGPRSVPRGNCLLLFVAAASGRNAPWCHPPRAPPSNPVHRLASAAMTSA